MVLEDYSCVLCNLGQEETSFHLFLSAHLAKPVGNTIPII